MLAKQPILDRERHLYGYELLYRSEQPTEEWNGDLATVEVMINAFLNIGMEQLAGEKPVFINFTDNLITQELARQFSPKDLIIELLEDITLTEEMKEKIILLSHHGYRLALDDVTSELFLQWHKEKMISYLTYIKVDFLAITSHEERAKLAKVIQALYPHITLLAEKVETMEDFKAAREIGFELFQGYFFMKPKVMESHEIPSNYFTYVQLIERINRKEFDLLQIAEIIQKDLSLSYKLLKLINSPAYRRVERINSIERAVVLLGQKEIKKWLHVLALRDSLKQNPINGADVLVKSSYYRAKMCENIAEMLVPEYKQEAFLVGYFSQLPAILRQPLDRLIKNLSLEETIEHALKEIPGILTDVYHLAVAFERVKWEEVDFYISKLNLSKEDVANAYQCANAWVLDVLKEELHTIE